MSLYGDFTEITDFSALALDLATDSKIDFYMRAVRYISSAGVRSWCNFLTTLADPDRAERVSYEFRHCSMAFVSQAAMVPLSVGRGTVVSLEAPYRCETCDRDDLRLLERNALLLDGVHVIPPDAQMWRVRRRSRVRRRAGSLFRVSAAAHIAFRAGRNSPDSKKRQFSGPGFRADKKAATLVAWGQTRRTSGSEIGRDPIAVIESNRVHTSRVLARVACSVARANATTIEAEVERSLQSIGVALNVDIATFAELDGSGRLTTRFQWSSVGWMDPTLWYRRESCRMVGSAPGSM